MTGVLDNPYDKHKRTEHHCDHEGLTYIEYSSYSLLFSSFHDDSYNPLLFLILVCSVRKGDIGNLSIVIDLASPCMNLYILHREMASLSFADPHI